MNCRIVELRCKEVVNVRDGARLGYVSDVEVDTECGKVVAIVVPGKGGFGGLFGGEDYVVPWEAICKIGEDIILVDYEFRYLHTKTKEKRGWSL